MSIMAALAPTTPCTLGFSKGGDDLPEALPFELPAGHFIPWSSNNLHSSSVVIKVTPLLSGSFGSECFSTSVSSPSSCISQTAARNRSLLCFRSRVMFKVSRYSVDVVARFSRRCSKEKTKKIKPE